MAWTRYSTVLAEGDKIVSGRQYPGPWGKAAGRVVTAVSAVATWMHRQHPWPSCTVRTRTITARDLSATLARDLHRPVRGCWRWELSRCRVGRNRCCGVQSGHTGLAGRTAVLDRVRCDGWMGSGPCGKTAVCTEDGRWSGLASAGSGRRALGLGSRHRHHHAFRERSRRSSLRPPRLPPCSPAAGSTFLIRCIALRAIGRDRTTPTVFVPE